MPRRQFNSLRYGVPMAGFSHVVSAPARGTLLFVSGLTSRSADGTIVHENDYERQTRQVMENLKNVLEDAGASLSDVVQIRTFVRDLSQWDVIERVERDYWGEVWPSSTAVEVARLYDERQLIEIEAVAQVDEPNS